MSIEHRITSALNLASIAQLHGGHQSIVFRLVDRSGRVVVAKAHDASMVDRATLGHRIDAIARLAELDRRVCRPRPLDGHRIWTIDHEGTTFHIVGWEYANGVPPQINEPDDARRMGQTLHELHELMGQLPPQPLPTVRALQMPAGDQPAATARRQLLHGDFNAGNLRFTSTDVRIFDFDDCGYGPVEFDVANALYMVLFDAINHGNPDDYQRFRVSFVTGYNVGASTQVSDALIDRYIDLRVEALNGWLRDLSNAPIGLRTATPAWHTTLREFVAAYAEGHTHSAPASPN